MDLVDAVANGVEMALLVAEPATTAMVVTEMSITTSMTAEMIDDGGIVGTITEGIMETTIEDSTER